MDSILEEDWSYFKEAYFFDESGTDKSGRPGKTKILADTIISLPGVIEPYGFFVSSS